MSCSEHERVPRDGLKSGFYVKADRRNLAPTEVHPQRFGNPGDELYLTVNVFDMDVLGKMLPLPSYVQWIECFPTLSLGSV